MGRKCHYAESGPMDSAQLALWAKVHDSSLDLTQQSKKTEWAPVGLRLATTGHGPYWSPAQGDKKKSRFGPQANLGFDGHPRPRSAAHHVLDGMPAATRGGDAPL
jgi:hypothetical protein